MADHLSAIYFKNLMLFVAKVSDKDLLLMLLSVFPITAMFIQILNRSGAKGLMSIGSDWFWSKAVITCADPGPILRPIC